MQIDEATPAQRAAWNQYQQARRDAGLPVVVEIPATDLRRGDILAGGGAITSEITRHPSGYLAAEVDWQTLVTWKADRTVPIYEREEGGR